MEFTRHDLNQVRDVFFIELGSASAAVCGRGRVCVEGQCILITLSESSRLLCSTVNTCNIS